MVKDTTKRGLREAGYPLPSEIQFQAIPIVSNAYNKKDILCTAHSGMGKTAIFLVSLLELIKPNLGKYKPHQCIILGNTRELAHQIYKDLRAIAQYYKEPQLRFGVYIGGLSFNENS